MKYYFNDNGNLQGPFSKAELVGKPITADTLVWMEGMATWQPAKDVPMFADILDGTYAGEQSVTQAGDVGQQNVVGRQPAPPYATQESTQYRPQSPYAPQQETFVPGAHNPSQPQPTAYQQPQPTAYQQPQRTAYQQPQPTTYQQPQRTAYQQPQPTYQQPQRTAYQQPQPMAYQQQLYPECVYAGPDPVQMQQPYKGGTMPSNHIGWTLTGTILSALNFLAVFLLPWMVIFVVPLIFGIIGLSKGASVTSLWTAGRIDAAEQASRQARTFGQASVWINVGLGVIGLLILAFVVFLGLGVMSGALTELG